MDREKDTIEKMLERERRRRISDKYRSTSNNKYRQRSNIRYPQKKYKKREDPQTPSKLPLRFMASVLIFAVFALYSNFGGAGGKNAAEKVKDILNKNINFDDINKTGEFIKNIGKTENARVDEKTLEKMEEDTFYAADYP